MLLSNIKNDQTRILMTIIRETAIKSPVNCKFGHNTPKVGDIVFCATTGLHDYTVGEVTEVLTDYDCMIRKFGSSNVCRIYNESFMVLEIPEGQKYLFYEGQKYQFLNKIKKVISKYGDIQKLFSNVEFIDDVHADVYIRERFGSKDDSTPFTIRVRWDRKKVTMKELWGEIESAYVAGQFRQVHKVFN